MKTLYLIVLGALLGILILPYIVIRAKELPGGTDLRSPAFPFSEARLLIDRTRWNPLQGAVEREHVIFDTILEEIDAAETFLVVDFFLWNPWAGALESEASLRPLADQLADALVAKRLQRPDMPLLVVTDPVNRAYGENLPPFFKRLAEAGVPVVFTDLSRLPESNRIYAPQARFWKQFIRLDESTGAKRRFTNPLNPEGPGMTVAQISRLLYFKANHRKVVVSGRAGGEARLVIGSFNPADGSANHSNMAALVSGPVAAYAAESELEVARWSVERPGQLLGVDASGLERHLAGIRAQLARVDGSGRAAPGAPTVTYLSEGAIRQAIVTELEQAGAGSRIDVGIFYFSDRTVVAALRGAIERGAALRLLLDANRDAFGHEKNGIPNRPVAAELMALAEDHPVEIRWAATHGEQFHTKALRIEGPDQSVLLLGSANWTRRNLANLNLEASLLFRNAEQMENRFDRYFEAVWRNTAGIEESLPYAARAESGWTSRWKRWLYRFQEWSGASTY